MSFKSQTYYGYKIGSNLSDMLNKLDALVQLNLNINDLDIIRNADAGGTKREDLISISNLSDPLYKTLDRYLGETGTYEKNLAGSSGIDSTLRGSLQVNGSVGGSAIRFKFLEYTRKLNYSSVTGTLIKNERLTDSADVNTTGIIKEVGTGYVIIGDITGGPFLPGRTFTGSYSGASFTLTTTVNTTVVKFADISTSRVSAWSTTSTIPTLADPIFYGGQIKIVDPGKVSVDKINWGQTAIERLKQQSGTVNGVPVYNGPYITGEAATHTITVNVNGVDLKLYAMKSIPLKFRGYFKRFYGQINFTQATAGSRITWRVVNVNTSKDIQTYPELGSTSSSTLSYSVVNAAERDIEIYYNPDNINLISLSNSGITGLPDARLPALTSLNISYNSITEMPDIKTVAPNLTNLNIGANNLYLSLTPSLRVFTKEIADKLPSTLTSLNMGSTFNGSIRCVDNTGNPITTGIGGANSYSVIEKACPNLQVFNINRSGSPFFSSDDYDTVGYLPSMPDTLTTYIASSNGFYAIPARGVKQLPNLVTFNVLGCPLTDPEFSLSSNFIQSVNISNTNLRIPDLSSKTTLVDFTCYSNGLRNGLYRDNNDEGTYKFSGCVSLQTLNFSFSSVEGFIPKFKNNTKLKNVYFYSANFITGGRPNNGEHGYSDGKTYVLYKDTFIDCPGITTFQVNSNSLLVGKGFEPDTFKNLASLTYLYWYSYGRTGLGGGVQLPDISSCAKLTTFIMSGNNFEGPVPSMASNNNISNIQLSNNKLTGPIPKFENRLNLNYLYLDNNNLTQFNGFKGTSKLYYVYIQNNQITGEIPMLSGSSNSPNLNYFFANNNQFTSYAPGSFAGLKNLYTLDISNNNLTAYDINNIIDDLYALYILTKRGYININIKNQSGAVGYVPTATGTAREKEIYDKIVFLRSKRWTITIG